MGYTTDDLIANIKRRASIPTNNSLFTEEDFLLLAQDELISDITPLIMSVNEEFFVHQEEVSIEANTASYSIPSAAVGQKLRNVSIVANPGTQGQEAIYSVPRLSLEDIGNYTWSTWAYGGFYLENNTLKLFPTPQVTGTLRLYYYYRPLELALEENCAQIVSINTLENEITLTSTPSNFASGGDATVVQGVAPFQTVTLSTSLTPATVNTFGLSSVEGLSVGDWVCPQGTSVIPQIPVEAQACLAQATAVKCLEAMGDDAGMQRAEAKLNQLKRSLVDLLTPRADGNPKKLVNKRGVFSSWGSGGGQWRWW